MSCCRPRMAGWPGLVRARERRRPAQGLVPAGRAGGALARRRLPVRQCAARCAARRARHRARLLPLRPLPQAGATRRSGSSCPRGSTAMSSPGSSRASRSRATSSTRRPTTWDRRSSSRRRARWRPPRRPGPTVVGDDLLERNFPLIHAVGRAAARAAPDRPHLGRSRPSQGDADRQGRVLRHRRPRHQADSGMLNMKKDMGGAANVLALAHMVMDAKLQVRLRVLIPAVENAISGQRLPPARRLSLAQGPHRRDRQHRRRGPADPRRCAGARRRGEAGPADRRLATLTGAARVALGTELPPFYTDDDDARRRRRALRGERERSAVAAAAVAPYDRCSIRRSPTSTTSRRAASPARSPPRCSCAGSSPRQGLAALRHLCLDADRQAGAAGRRRMPGRARSTRCWRPLR